MEDTVLTQQRNNLLECDSEHSGSSSEARSEVDLLGSDAKEDEKKKKKTITTMRKTTKITIKTKSWSLVLILSQTRYSNPKISRWSVRTWRQLLKAKSTWRELKSCFFFSDSLLKYLDKRKEKGKKNYKWDGSLQTLKDFVALILKKYGQWCTKNPVVAN